MKLVNKLLLVSAIAASSQAFALESMTDAAMSQTTGQDGVTVTINLVNGINAQAILHDTNGVAPNGTTGSAGAIVFGNGTTAGNFNISSGIITLDIDADGGTGTTSTTGAVLNVKIGLPSALTVTTGDISVAKSAGLGGALTNSTKILNSTTLSLGGLNVNMQLGAEAQGSMLAINGAITGGITLNNFALLDAYNGTVAQTNIGIGATSVKIKDNGAGANLTLGDIKGDVTAAAGLQFTVASIGSATGVDVQMTGLKLGDQGAATTLGNFELRGLNMNGTIIGVKGH